MSRRGERLLPIIVAFLVGVPSGIYMDYEPDFEYIIAATIPLGLIVAGFTETQRNMLLSMSGSKVLRFAANSGYYEDILGYLSDCVYAGLFATVVSVTGIFLGENEFLNSVWLATWVGSISLMVAVLARNQILMHRVFTRFMEEQKTPFRRPSYDKLRRDRERPEDGTALPSGCEPTPDP